MSLQWQVLIATIPHRHDRLNRLLAELDDQVLPGFGVLLYRDNLEAGIAAKRQALLDAARARYVSFADDDDMVFSGFIPRVMTALAQGPDCVGFTVEYVVDGNSQVLAEHLIRHSGWHNWPDRLVRDISHLNPVRRDIAVRARFEGGYSEESRWADAIRDSGLLTEEVWVTGLAYRYQFSPADCAMTSRQPWPGPFPELPSYPWLTVLHAPGSC